MRRFGMIGLVVGVAALVAGPFTGELGGMLAGQQKPGAGERRVPAGWSGHPGIVRATAPAQRAPGACLR